MKTLARLIAAIVYAVSGLVILVCGIAVFVVAWPLGFAVLVGCLFLYVLGVGTVIVGSRRH